MIQAVVDVDGGGRCTIEVADAEPKRVRVGPRVAFTFRRLFTAGGVHDYFWKSHLLDDGSSTMASHGITDKVAVVGMGCTRFGERWDNSTEDLILEAFSECIGSTPNIDKSDIDAYWLGTLGSGQSGLTLSRALVHRGQTRHPRRELLRHWVRGLSQRLLWGRVGRLRRGDGARSGEAEGFGLLGSDAQRPAR